MTDTLLLRRSPPRRGAGRLLAALGLGGALLVAPSVALAQDCATPYSATMASEDLGTMTVALRELDEAAFNKAGARMDTGLACLTEPLPVPAYASAYRFLGAWQYLTGDKDLGTRWMRTALEVDPAFEWDVNDLPQGHPLRDAFDGERAMAGQPPVEISGMRLDVPEGQELLVDGKPLSEPALTTGRPHVVQLVDTGSARVVSGWLVDGNDLPEQVLITEEAWAARQAALAEAQGGKKKKKGNDSVASTSTVGSDPYAVQTVKRIRPKAKTPLLVTGAVGVVASGVIYGLSFPARDKFDSATTTDALLDAQSATNTLVIASGATLAVGVGIGIVGIQLDADTPGLVIGRRF
ncbi:MAG: hypothetical protein H6742_06175 [Alphaproteobacteria bacterium]|nr:hypothetical protein [Alphaproteobacteria bacterium]